MGSAAVATEASPRAIRVLGVELRAGRTLLVATLLALAAVAPQIWHQLTLSPSFRLVDLVVYRDAGVSFLHHHDVYHHVTPAPQRLPFTYPPTAALLGIPLALLPQLLVQILWTLGQYVLIAGLVLVSTRRALAAAGPRRAALLAPAFFVAASYLFPVRSVVRFGQVGLLLAALVMTDLLVRRPRWPRGLLIGLATAMKLTPGVFIVFLWVSGRRREARTAAAAFAGFVAATFAIAPHTSWEYWGWPHGALFAADRLGDNTNTSNQALRGFVLRMHLPHTAASLVWLALVCLVGFVGFRLAAREHARGEELRAVALVGLLAVLLSPVAWIHHMVWVIPLIGSYLGGLTDRRRIAAALALAVFFSLEVPWWGNHLIFNRLEKSRITYRAPDALTDQPLPLQGRNADFPTGTVFTLHPQGKPPRVLRPEAFRPTLDACLVAAMERRCLEARHPGSPIWYWRLLESSYCLTAAGLVLIPGVRRRRPAAVAAPASAARP